MKEALVNYFPILVAAIASMIFGALWYSPLMFGKLWMKLSKLTAKDIENAKKKSMAKSYIIAFISNIIMASVMALFLRNSLFLLDGLVLACWIWIGFIGTTTLSSVLWENKPLKLYTLNNLHSLISLIIMGLIISGW